MVWRCIRLERNYRAKKGQDKHKANRAALRGTRKQLSDHGNNAANIPAPRLVVRLRVFI